MMHEMTMIRYPMEYMNTILNDCRRVPVLCSIAIRRGFTGDEHVTG